MSSDLSSYEKLYNAYADLLKVLSRLSEHVDYISRTVYQIAKNQEKIIKRLVDLSTIVNTINARVNELDNKVNTLAKDLENLRNEFYRETTIIKNRIKDLEERVNQVEKRVEQAEKNLDAHLKKQDEVLESHSEALLNDIALQVMSSIKSRYDEEASITLIQINRTPLVVVENHRKVMVVTIAEKYEEPLQKMLENIKQKIEMYTDKETTYKILTLEIPKKLSKEIQQIVEPVWTYIE